MSGVDCRRLLEETPLKVITYVGNNGVIGRVLEEPHRGLVVLFASQPQPGMHVICYSYDIRTSPKTGKNYVKCFEWVKPEEYEEAKKECAKRLVDERIEELVEPLPEDFREIAKRLIRGETVTPNELPENVIAVAVSGVVTSYKDSAFVAILDNNWVLYDNGEYCDAPAIVSRMPFIEGRVEVPGARTVSICGHEYTFLPERYVKLVNAIRRLEELEIPDEMKERVKARILAAWSTGEAE